MTLQVKAPILLRKNTEMETFNFKTEAKVSTFLFSVELVFNSVIFLYGPKPKTRHPISSAAR